MRRSLICLVCLALILGVSSLAGASGPSAAKPAPDAVLAQLLAGNARFVAGQPQAAHRDQARVALAATANQGDYALATILSCSDSRVPVELLFDVGVMDVFVIRVAGNVAQTDETGSIEYGVAHVNTPVLMVLGHTCCGAVTAVINEVEGRSAKWERNIPPLVAPIVPAVKRAKAVHPDQCCAALLPAAVEENVWEALANVFKTSPATRELVKSGQIKAVGAVYDLASGKVTVLDQAKPAQLLVQSEAAPDKAVEAYHSAK